MLGPPHLRSHHDLGDHIIHCLCQGWLVPSSVSVPVNTSGSGSPAKLRSSFVLRPYQPYQALAAPNSLKLDARPCASALTLNHVDVCYRALPRSYLSLLPSRCMPQSPTATNLDLRKVPSQPACTMDAATPGPPDMVDTRGQHNVCLTMCVGEHTVTDC